MKKLMAVVLAVVLSLSLMIGACAQEEPSDWAKGEVDYAAAEFLKAAMGNLDYAKEITREEFAVIALYLYASRYDMELPELSVENPFTDCNNPLVATAYGLGLVKGVADDKFDPTASVTREQICVMITRISQIDLESIRDSLPALDSFKDGDMVSDWAKDSVRLMVMSQIIKGTDEGKINPLGNCTTQEALIIAKRINK